MLTVGLYIQVQLPESFGNLSALKYLYLAGCTGLVHTRHTTCMHTPICMYCMHYILRYYLRRQNRRVWRFVECCMHNMQADVDPPLP